MAAANDMCEDRPDRVPDSHRRVERQRFNDYTRTGILTMPVVTTAQFAHSHCGELSADRGQAPVLSKEEAAPVMSAFSSIHRGAKIFEDKVWFDGGLQARVMGSSVPFLVGENEHVQVTIGTIKGCARIVLTVPKTRQFVMLATTADEARRPDGSGQMDIEQLECDPTMGEALIEAAIKNFPELREQRNEGSEPHKPNRSGRVYISPAEYSDVNTFFAGTDYVVRATLFEAHILRAKYSKDRSDMRLVDWVRDNQGISLEVGKIGDFPVEVTYEWDIINGRRVMFWDITSRVTDDEMATRFLSELSMPEAEGRHTTTARFAECIKFCLTSKQSTATIGEFLLSVDPVNEVKPRISTVANAEAGPPDIALFDEVVGIVIATDMEQKFLQKECTSGMYQELVDSWQSREDVAYKIGEIDGRPVVIEVNLVEINGKRVALVNPVSSVVDLGMIGKWVGTHIRKGRDQDDCPATDPMNFPLVLNAVWSDQE